MTATRYLVRQGEGAGGPALRGAAADLWRFRGPEVVISGPAETGKTVASLHKLHCLLYAFPGSQGVMLRKVRDTIFGTCLQTYLRRILPEEGAVRPFGGERPQWFDYPNGSRLWLAGMDDPGKALSSERDFVYVNQCEELALDDWEVLTTRATGRAGNAPYGQVIGDCNPGPPYHWILARSDQNRGPLRLLESRHEDNPSLWDGAAWTEQGRRTLAALDGLTGTRRDRLRHGRWVSAEGVVYDSFDARLHVIEPFIVPPSWPRFRSVDFGVSNPFVCQWWALDGDGVMYLYREVYMTRRTVAQHAVQINDLSRGERFEATVTDHDRADRETLDRAGAWTTPAVKDISTGVQAVQDRLARGRDGRPRLLLMRGCLVERDESLAAARKPLCTRDEFEVYQWQKGLDGRPVKELPLDRDNHGMDALRYAVRWADARAGGAFAPGSIGTSSARKPSPFAAGRERFGTPGQRFGGPRNQRY